MTDGPWGTLDPRLPEAAPGDPAPRLPEAGTWRILARGLRKRCPRCGARGIFVSWFRLRASCERCDLRFEREEGGYLGAMVLNYIAAMGLWIIGLVVFLVATVPDVPVAPVLAMSIVVLVVVPLWFYPRSKGIWAGVEYLIARSDPDYRPPPARRDPRAKDLE